MGYKPGGQGWIVTSLFYRGLLLVDALLLVLGSASSPSFSEFTFTVEPTDVIVERDKPAILNCSAHHEQDTPEIQWIRDGVFLNLEGESRRHLLENGFLKFDYIVHNRNDRPDEGLFQCVASVDHLGAIVSRKAKVQVAYLGKNFNEEALDLSVHLGDVAVFACDIDGAPEPIVRWYKDERELNTEHVNYRIHKDGYLEISSVQFSDFGRYKCTVENLDKSKTSRVATLSQDSNVATYQGVSPRFVITPKKRNVVQGSSVMLYCAANGRDRQGRPPTISWLKDGATIDMANLDSRFSIIGRGSLQIENVEESDTGSYTCRAYNQEDSVDSDAMLTVQVPPQFRKRPKNVFAHVNADVEFECDIYGVPQPTITWLKNGDVVIPSDYFQIVDNRNLRILGLVRSDDGIYQCMAENAIGNTQASAQLVILQTNMPIPTTPYMTTPSHRWLIGSPDAPASELPGIATNLVAAIVSTRFVTLSWQMPMNIGSSEIIAYSVFWKEHKSDRERVLNTTQLEANVQHLKPNTSYEFRVQAYNRAGPSKKFAQITVNTQQEIHVPGSPTNMAAFPLSSTSIKIKWGPPQPQDKSAGPIIKYKLYYYQVGATVEESIDIHSGTEYVLEGLEKYAEYSFRLLAYNNNGPGMSTEEVASRTFSDVPSEPPQNVTLETASSTSIIVRWEPPPKDAQNGIITGYKIRYKKKGSRGSDVATTDGSRRAFPLLELQRGKSYQIRLQALTLNGSSPATIWYGADTYTNDLDESIVPGPPTSLRVRPFASSIAVSWTPPSKTDVMVRGYILGYGIGIPDVYKQDLDEKQRYYTIKSLIPSSQYVISLRSYNNIGEGRPIYETIITREETTPEPMTPMIPPVGLKATVLSPNTILVTWSDTTLGRNQRIVDNRFYTVKYNPRGARKSRMINSTDLNVHIDDLKANTEYEFTVKVIKGRRQSTWSMSVLNKTFEDAPSTAPRDVTPVAVENKPTWIQLNWQPPRQPNGQITDDITGYLVFYTTDATQHDREWVVEGVLGDKLSTTIQELTPETTYYFKVQARNSKGFGPMSPTVIFRTPRIDGTGGGQIETPNDYGQIRHNTPSRGKNAPSQDGQNRNNNGIPPMVLWIVIACVSGVTVIAIIVVTVIICKRKSDSDRKKRNGYKPATKVKSGPKDIKPPDLWIHDMEMKNIDKGQNPETMTVSPIPRENQDKHMEENPGEHHYDSHDEDRYRRPTPIRPKPIMIPVEQPPPPREPIATAIPNGHILSNGDQPPGMPPRPLYPRTQYTSHAPPYTSTPRVNAGDLPPPVSGFTYIPQRTGLTCSIKPQQQPPPPSSTSALGQTSPYKKPAPPTTSATTPMKPRSPMPVVTPKAPDVTIQSGNNTDTELPKSYSAEELSAEMANLEGLMKDLNAITQQEFEC